MRTVPVHQSCAAMVMACVISYAGAAPSAGTGRAKLAGDLAARLNGQVSGSVDVIVQGDASYMSQLRSNLSSRGAVVGRDLKLVGGLAASLTVSDLDALVADGKVRRISLDRPLSAAVNAPSDSDSLAWPQPAGFRADGLTGLGIGVAVIDSGISPHQALGDAVVESVDFVDPTRQGGDLSQDPYGHGTHVAGIIAGRFSGGVAPAAHLVSLRVLDHKGGGRSSDVIAALEWCIAHQFDWNLRVVNLSLGQPVAEAAADDPLAQAVESAWRSGLVVVTAAGNAGMLGSGYGMISSPANDPLVIAVGALDDRGTPERRDDEAAAFSSKGPTRFDFTVKPDLLAPGTHIVSLRVPHSTLDRSMPEARVADAAYFEMSGSSMAAARVSGAVAVMLEANPTLTPDDVKARLMSRADHSGDEDIYTRGAGLVDLNAALAAVGRASASASPAVTLSASAGGDVVITDIGATWGDASVWSLENVYGDPTLWNADVAQNHELFDDACMSGQGLTWQHAVANGIVWQHAAALGIIWQTLTGEGLTWQHLRGSGLTWQHSYGDGSCPF